MLDAGVGDDHVEAAEPLGRCLDRRFVRAGVGQVRLERRARTIGIGPEVDREHVHPVGLQPLGDRAADPTCSAGDERRLTR